MKPTPGAVIASEDILISSLGAVSKLWLDKQGDFRKEAVAALAVSTGFNMFMIEAALDAAFEELSEAKLRDFCRAHPAIGEAAARAPRKVLHILAGNVFTSWLPGAVITLLLGMECSLKPSSSEPVFAPLWKRSVRLIDGPLGDKIHVVSWNDDLLESHEAVVAYGSDESLSKLRQMTPVSRRFIGYGHKFSVALIFKEALAAENHARLMQQIQRDSEPFNGQGCLSPKIIFREGEEPFTDWPSLRKELETFRPHLSALGYAGPQARMDALRLDLESLGFSRICPLGEMQRPPLSWRNGGIDLVEELLKGQA